MNKLTSSITCKYNSTELEKTPRGCATQAAPCPWDPCPNGHTSLHAMEVPRLLFLEHHVQPANTQRLKWIPKELTSFGCTSLRLPSDFFRRRKLQVPRGRAGLGHEEDSGSAKQSLPCRDTPGAAGHSQSSSHCCYLGLSRQKEKLPTPS